MDEDDGMPWFALNTLTIASILCGLLALVAAKVHNVKLLILFTFFGILFLCGVFNYLIYDRRCAPFRDFIAWIFRR